MSMIPTKDLSLIASFLDENQIPHVVGWDASRVLWGVPFGLDETQSIIHDEYFSTGIDLITNAGYTPCTDGKCRIVQETNPLQIPEGHFHTTCFGRSVISVYKKSGIFWALPDFPVQEPVADDRNFMLSNDPQLPTNWNTEFPPAKILTQVALTETLLLLQARDVDHLNGLSYAWGTYICQIRMHCGRFWIKKKDLLPHFHGLWELLIMKPPPGFKWGYALQDARRDLRDRMLSEGNMPPPDTIAFRDPRLIEINTKYAYATLKEK